MTSPRQYGNRRGTVMIYTVVLMTVLLAFVALTIDVGRMEIARQRAQQVCDAAVLAGAWYLTGEQSSTRVDAVTGTPTGGDGSAALTAKYAALANNEASPHWATLTADGSRPGVTVSFPPYPAQTGYVISDAGTQVPIRLGESIRVQAVINVPMTFARILGIQQASVAASATAIVGLTPQTPTPVTVTGSALPFAVANTKIWNTSVSPPTVRIQMGDQVALKVTNPNDPAGFIGSGNFLAVSYPGDHGGDDYRDRIANASLPVTFTLNQEIDLTTEPGNISGPTAQGITTRLGNDVYPYPAANGTAWNSWLSSYDPNTGNRTSTKRMGIVPIIQDPGSSLNGRESVTVIGFAGFFIEGFETVTVGGSDYVRLTGRFAGGIYTANGITWLDPSAAPPYSSTVTSVRLIN
jgi:hypothetical protein